MAIRKAGIAPDEVDYINAHGTSTPYNDRLETLAIKNCFGEHADKLAISSTKSMTGHLLGGAGGLEAGITALAVHASDRAADDQPRRPGSGVRSRLRAAHRAAQMPIRYALSNSFGFGGTNAALLFKKYEGIRLTRTTRLRGHGACLKDLTPCLRGRVEPVSDYEDRRLHQAGPDPRVAAASERRRRPGSASRTSATR